MESLNLNSNSKNVILDQLQTNKANKLQEIKNYLFNYVNKGTMICKITSANVKKEDFDPVISCSKSVANFKMPNLLKSKKKESKLNVIGGGIGGDGNIRKIDLEILVISDEFFDFLPKVKKNDKSKVKSKKRDADTSLTSFSKLLRSSN